MSGSKESEQQGQGQPKGKTTAESSNVFKSGVSMEGEGGAEVLQGDPLVDVKPLNMSQSERGQQMDSSIGDEAPALSKSMRVWDKDEQHTSFIDLASKVDLTESRMSDSANNNSGGDRRLSEAPKCNKKQAKDPEAKDNLKKSNVRKFSKGGNDKERCIGEIVEGTSYDDSEDVGVIDFDKNVLGYSRGGIDGSRSINSGNGESDDEWNFKKVENLEKSNVDKNYNFQAKNNNQDPNKEGLAAKQIEKSIFLNSDIVNSNKKPKNKDSPKSQNDKIDRVQGFLEDLNQNPQQNTEESGFGAQNPFKISNNIKIAAFKTKQNSMDHHIQKNNSSEKQRRGSHFQLVTNKDQIEEGDNDKEEGENEIDQSTSNLQVGQNNGIASSVDVETYLGSLLYWKSKDEIKRIGSHISDNFDAGLGQDLSKNTFNTPTITDICDNSPKNDNDDEVTKDKKGLFSKNSMLGDDLEYPKDNISNYNSSICSKSDSDSGWTSHSSSSEHFESIKPKIDDRKAEDSEAEGNRQDVGLEDVENKDRGQDLKGENQTLLKNTNNSKLENQLSIEENEISEPPKNNSDIEDDIIQEKQIKVPEKAIKHDQDHEESSEQKIKTETESSSEEDDDDDDEEQRSKFISSLGKPPMLRLSSFGLENQKRMQFNIENVAITEPGCKTDFNSSSITDLPTINPEENQLQGYHSMKELRKDVVRVITPSQKELVVCQGDKEQIDKVIQQGQLTKNLEKNIEDQKGLPSPSDLLTKKAYQMFEIFVSKGNFVNSINKKYDLKIKNDSLNTKEQNGSSDVDNNEDQGQTESQIQIKIPKFQKISEKEIEDEDSLDKDKKDDKNQNIEADKKYIQSSLNCIQKEVNLGPIDSQIIVVKPPISSDIEASILQSKLLPQLEDTSSHSNTNILKQQMYPVLIDSTIAPDQSMGLVITPIKEVRRENESSPAQPLADESLNAQEGMGNGIDQSAMFSDAFEFKPVAIYSSGDMVDGKEQERVPEDRGLISKSIIGGLEPFPKKNNIMASTDPAMMAGRDREANQGIKFMSTIGNGKSRSSSNGQLQIQDVHDQRSLILRNDHSEDDSNSQFQYQQQQQQKNSESKSKKRDIPLIKNDNQKQQQQKKQQQQQKSEEKSKNIKKGILALLESNEDSANEPETNIKNHLSKDKPSPQIHPLPLKPGQDIRLQNDPGLDKINIKNIKLRSPSPDNVFNNVMDPKMVESELYNSPGINLKSRALKDKKEAAQFSFMTLKSAQSGDASNSKSLYSQESNPSNANSNAPQPIIEVTNANNDDEDDDNDIPCSQKVILHRENPFFDTLEDNRTVESQERNEEILNSQKDIDRLQISEEERIKRCQLQGEINGGSEDQVTYSSDKIKGLIPPPSEQEGQESESIPSSKNIEILEMEEPASTQIDTFFGNKVTPVDEESLSPQIPSLNLGVNLPPRVPYNKLMFESQQVQPNTQKTLNQDSGDVNVQKEAILEQNFKDTSEFIEEGDKTEKSSNNQDNQKQEEKGEEEQIDNYVDDNDSDNSNTEFEVLPAIYCHRDVQKQIEGRGLLGLGEREEGESILMNDFMKGSIQNHLFLGLGDTERRGLDPHLTPAPSQIVKSENPSREGSETQLGNEDFNQNDKNDYFQGKEIKIVLNIERTDSNDTSRIQEENGNQESGEEISKIYQNNKKQKEDFKEYETPCKDDLPKKLRKREFSFSNKNSQSNPNQNNNPYITINQDITSPTNHTQDDNYDNSRKSHNLNIATLPQKSDLNTPPNTIRQLNFFKPSKEISPPIELRPLSPEDRPDNSSQRESRLPFQNSSIRSRGTSVYSNLSNDEREQVYNKTILKKRKLIAQLNELNTDIRELKSLRTTPNSSFYNPSTTFRSKYAARRTIKTPRDSKGGTPRSTLQKGVIGRRERQQLKSLTSEELEEKLRGVMGAEASFRYLQVVSDGLRPSCWPFPLNQ